MAKSHNPNEGVVGHKYKCAFCGKEVEVPLCAEHEAYGWWCGKKRCCSYTCMRKMEQTIQPRSMNFSMKRGASVHNDALMRENFGKLQMYMDLRDAGVTAEESAKRAGFNSRKTAANCRRWMDTPEWKAWKEEQSGNCD